MAYRAREQAFPAQDFPERSCRDEIIGRLWLGRVVPRGGAYDRCVGQCLVAASRLSPRGVKIRSAARSMNVSRNVFSPAWESQAVERVERDEGRGRQAALARWTVPSDGAAFSSAHARLPATLSAATALLQLLTGEPSGHDDSGTLDLS